jgi:NarL family two-component system response regulator LiaR
MLVDDHSVFRLGLRNLLECEDQLEVVAEAESGHEAVERARQARPDVVVMDVRMPVKDGIVAAREIKAELPETEIVMVSAFGDEDQLVQALQAGASSFLVKDEGSDAILQAVLNASAGKPYLGATVAKQLMDRLVSQVHKTPSQDRRSHLTERERSILQLVAQGGKNRDIAAKLGISDRTVGNHLANIFSKLQVSDRAHAVMTAIRRGIVKI